MKTKTYLIGLLCIAALTGLFTITKAPAQGNAHPSHQVVILGDIDAWHYEYRATYDGQTQKVYVVDGPVVEWIDASPNAPEAILGSSLSATIAAYMDRGFSHELLGNNRRHLLKK